MDFRVVDAGISSPNIFFPADDVLVGANVRTIADEVGIEILGV